MAVLKDFKLSPQMCAGDTFTALWPSLSYANKIGIGLDLNFSFSIHRRRWPTFHPENQPYNESLKICWRPVQGSRN